MSRSIKQLTTDLQRKTLKLAKIRDELRYLEDEIVGLENAATEAVENLECAIERLSELV